MDSIDVYLEKKRKRTAYQMNYQTKLKVDICLAINTWQDSTFNEFRKKENKNYCLNHKFGYHSKSLVIYLKTNQRKHNAFG